MSKPENKLMSNFKLVGNPIDTPAKDTKIEKSTFKTSHKPTPTELLQLSKRVKEVKKNNVKLNSRESLDYVQHITPKKSASSSATSHSNHVDNLAVLNEIKARRQLETDNFTQKKRIEELENKLRVFTDLKAENDELKRQIIELIRKETDLNEEVVELRKLNESNYIENSNLKERISFLEGGNHETIQSLREDVKRLKDEILEEGDLKAKLKSEYFEELKTKDDKLNNLKKQIALSFKDNSWERQQQIEELSRELKRSQEECEDLKARLVNNTEPKKPYGSCKTCPLVANELEERTLILSAREQQLSELIALFKKFQSQTNFEKELIFLVTSNKNYSDLFSSLKLETHTKNTKLEPITPTKRKNNLTGNK